MRRVANSNEVSAQLVIDGYEWVGAGLTPDGKMVGSSVVVGAKGLDSGHIECLLEDYAACKAPYQGDNDLESVQVIQQGSLMTLRFSGPGIAGDEFPLQGSFEMVFAAGKGDDFSTRHEVREAITVTWEKA